MSHSPDKSKVKSMTILDLCAAKKQGRKLSMVTCYDAAFAALIEPTAIDLVLVGDSLGNVVLGFEDTVSVTMDHMVHHAAAVSRVLQRPFLVVDMPFMSYKQSCEQALANAARLMQNGGARAVKLEGGAEICPQVEALVSAGIPVMGHLGLTPQSVHQLGGYKVQGRENAAIEKMISDARALESAGAFAVVLEMVPEDLGAKITQALSIPTIGIGAGRATDGQVLVLHDLLGFNKDFNPKFLKKYAQLGEVIKSALSDFDQEVKDGVFPSSEHVFTG